MKNKIIFGNAQNMEEIPDNSVHLVVTFSGWEDTSPTGRG